MIVLSFLCLCFFVPTFTCYDTCVYAHTHVLQKSLVSAVLAQKEMAPLVDTQLFRADPNLMHDIVSLNTKKKQNRRIEKRRQRQSKFQCGGSGSRADEDKDGDGVDDEIVRVLGQQIGQRVSDTVDCLLRQLLELSCARTGLSRLGRLTGSVGGNGNSGIGSSGSGGSGGYGYVGVVPQVARAIVSGEVEHRGDLDDLEQLKDMGSASAAIGSVISSGLRCVRFGTYYSGV